MDSSLDKLNLLLLGLLALVLFARFVIFAVDPITGLAIGYGYGDSMDTEEQEMCNVYLMENPDNYESLDGEIISFTTPDAFDKTDRITHRVVADMDTYDSSTSPYYIDGEGMLINEIDGGYRVIGDAYNESVDELEGERMLVAKGDNNIAEDPYLIPEGDVVGVVTRCIAYF